MQIDIDDDRAPPNWTSNAQVLQAFAAAHAASAAAGTGDTVRNVLTAAAELARVIEPKLFMVATPHGILKYARWRQTKCKFLRGDGQGGWACQRGLVCPMLAGGAPDACGSYEPLMWSSQLQNLYALSTFYTWLRIEGAVPANPVRDGRAQWLQETKAQRDLEDEELGRTPTDDELVLLLDALPYVHGTMCKVMAKAGLRIGEALALQLKDIDMKRRLIRIPPANPWCNKRRGLRLIKMDAELYAILFVYLKRRHAKAGVTALFPKRTGKEFSRTSGKSAVNDCIQAAAIRAGIQAEDAPPQERITPHSMRRWFCNQLGTADLGGVPLGVQLLLRGDKLPGALRRYLEPALALPLWRDHMPLLPTETY